MNKEILKKIDRIHPYPAKFTVDLAIEYIKKYTNEGDMVYDPFVGSGTTLLASSVLHRKGFGTDINHIAILISKGKLLRLSKIEITHLFEFIDKFEISYMVRVKTVTPYAYPSIEHWFCQNSILVLSLILEDTIALENENERIFVKLVTSSIINTVSNQESDTRYAAIEKPYLTIEKVANIFIKKYRATLTLMEVFNNEELGNEQCIPILLNSKDCRTILADNSVDLILTSPPYVNTYDYYLYHKHRMNWLGFDVKYSMETEIGSRREFSSLKHSEDKFSADLSEIFVSCNAVLKPGGKVVLVMGDGRVAGKIYDAKENMIRICTPLGWELIDYSYSNLDDTSRSFRQSYRTKGKKEHIMIFSKEEI